ncbi:hypothetical protein F5I97DRAFT_1195771 [Phlebopus sp. FC_14]|nr:hypothetical protein F5I97DRAFT_1195771 [Phlebopus sp. FC_14]
MVAESVAGSTEQSGPHISTIPSQDGASQQMLSRPSQHRSVSQGMSFLTPSPQCIPKLGWFSKKVEVDGSKSHGSLPPVRSSSPFKVAAPIHQPWHERQTTFELSDRRHGIPASVSFPEAQLRMAAVSTDFLASLAWIGIPTRSGSSPVASLGEVQNCAASGNGGICVAMAIDDENITDEVLVNQLEDFRRSCSLSEHGTQRPSRSSVIPHSPNSPCLPPFPDQNNTTKSGVVSWLSQHPTFLQRASLGSPTSTSLVPEEDDAVWKAARKALLCIREIMRTERKYQQALRTLFSAQTTTPPPPLMLSFIPSLIRVSEMLLKGFLDDPSAWGVSTTFMACEDDVEAAMVSWCSVAGTFFTDADETLSGAPVARWRLRRSGMTPLGSRGSILGVSSPTETSPQSSPRPPSILTPMTIANSRIESEERQRVGEGWRLTRGMGMHGQQSPNTTTITGVSTGRKTVPINEVETKSTQFVMRVSARDLAIQPTQRVMRYVLLYGDLLQCTPSTSPSRPLVERALEAATRIANKCDGAQENAAFLRSP